MMARGVSGAHKHFNNVHQNDHVSMTSGGYSQERKDYEGQSIEDPVLKVVWEVVKVADKSSY